MAQPSYSLRGAVSQSTDTRQVRWTRILGSYQNAAGADARNNPAKTDTIRRLMLKLARATKGSM